MGELFLRTVTVSLAVALLLLPLLPLRGWLEKRYAPQTRWTLWLAVAAVLLTMPFLPRRAAPVQVEVPARTVAYTQVERPAPAVTAPTPVAAPTPAVTAPAAVPAPAATGPVIIPGQPIQPTAPEPAAPAPAAYRSVDWTELAAVLWAAVAALLLAVQAVRYAVARRRLMRSSRPVGREAGVELRVLPGLETPIAMGFFRPVVLLPAEETDPMALRHELTHIKRRDIWGKALLFLACAVHWFDPMVWQMARWADRDVEACCDAAVAGCEDTAYKRAYGELLLASAAEERPLPFATRFGGGKEQMKSRLSQLFRPGKRSRALVCALLAAAVLLSGLVACKQTPAVEDGLYCVAVDYPTGISYAEEGEDGNSIRFSGLLKYSEADGPQGGDLGEHTLPLAEDLTLWRVDGEERELSGERGSREWKRSLFSFVYWPSFRAELYPGRKDYLVVEVKDGAVKRLSWTLVSRTWEAAAPAEENTAPLTENTMPHLDFYDPETRFLVYHTRTGVYFRYEDGGEEFHVDTAQGERVVTTVDVRPSDEVWFSDCFPDGSGSRYYQYDVQQRSIQTLDGPFTPGPEPLRAADPDRIFDQGMYQPSHTYSLWSNALELSDGTLAALAVNRIIENGGTMDYLELVRMGEHWWEENRLLTPERIPGPADYTSPDWGFTLHLPESMAGRYLVERDYNADGLPSWGFYAKEEYKGPNGNGFLFTIYAQDAETARNGGEESAILGEKNGIAYTMTTWPHREGGYSAGYLELLDAVAAIEGEDLDLSGATRSTGPLWPLDDVPSGQEVILQANEGDKSVTILAPEYGWVKSVAAGTVYRVAQLEYSGTYSVGVRHGNGWQTIYSGLGSAWVSEGDRVERGKALGYAAKEKDLSSITLTWLEGRDFIDPRTVDWRRMDFSPLTEDDFLMAGDDRAAESLRAVLRGEATFYNVEAQEYQYADALPYSGGVPVTVCRFAQVDMDHDTVPELVLWLRRGENESALGSIVLRYEKGWVHGYPLSCRSMLPETLKADGTFQWSGSASEWGYAKMDFLSGTAEKFEAEDQAQSAKEDAVWVELSANG